MKNQRGGFLLGMVVGLLIGLAISLGAALYISKVPVPFVNKVPQRTAEQDAAEAERNRNWDPNSSLAGKPARPGGGASGAVSGAAVTPPPVINNTPQAPPGPRRDPAAILAGGAVPPAPVSASGGATGAAADPFGYFLQAGAYTRIEEAEQQRARLAMLGLSARITDREQSGRTVFRVRLGPFDNKEAAGAVKEKLDGANIETALVRVQK